ncbi:MAG: 50S ribosomal protein L6 [Gammaproteobacteria bacterium]|nr:50S ribosomal protein L6 [Gammaproteobacteria bacterium]
MSRVAKAPVELPGGVEVAVAPGATELSVSGAKGKLQLKLSGDVGVAVEDRTLHFEPRDQSHRTRAMAGTVRSLVNNMVMGVSQGFERRLQLVGVGYRAQAQGRTLNLQLGFSHPVRYAVPEGVDVQTPTATEIVVGGADKQLVGQVAAEIRAFRPPEPYKGKGVRYLNERVRRKEAKKK